MKGAAAWRGHGGVAAAVADHLGASVGPGARRARLCLYGVALAFALFAAFLAFAPSLPAPSSPSPSAAWLGGFLASASPYRAQVSGFFSSLFPANSSSSSSPVVPGGVVGPRRSGGGFPSGGEAGTNGSSASLPGERPGSGGGSGSGGVRTDISAPVNATASAARSSAPPNDHVLDNPAASNSSGTAGADAKAGAGLRGDISASGNGTASSARSNAPPHDHVGGGGGASSNSTEIAGAASSNSSGIASGADAKAGANTIGGSAQNGTAATAGAPILAINGPGANASSADPPTSNGTSAPFISQTGSAVSAATHSNGDAPPRRGDPSKKRTAQDSAAGSTQKQSTSRAPAASAGSSNSTRNPQKETTATSSQRSAGNSSAVPVMGNAPPAKGAAIAGGGRNKEYSVEEMGRCDMFYGNWVRDDSYPLYAPGSCPHVDESFNCFLNGRPDKDYQRLRWKPSGCSIPRLNPTDMLERLRGKRLVFVGDSLNRNMWESLVCILRNSIKDKRKVFEVSGNHKFRAEGSYSFLFQDYNCTVEFFRSPFLVQELEVPLKHGKVKETLRLDKIDRSSSRYKNADIIVFNTGHWWTHEKTSLGKDYYQEGDQVYSELNVHDAYRRALNTWAKWVDSNVNPKKTTVFFRGYSASHFSGGQWNSGGSCDKETEPITNEQYLIPYPQKMSILEEVLHGMKTPVAYMNITRMTDYRKEGHPSIYRKQKLSEEERKATELYQDCSHWCLPGVPDSWNEVLYAKILVKQHQMLHQ
ncbi:protein trichome birefringence-like 1 [Lolium rigidum]|uniref:protein trichome birefringence-like 1 n=1 Tax=Lolium rigidum TaxID=89674 RepID=UPI001F5DF84B|nr:protein trichome birefringence-like 1 [Lolium rigidum]